MPGATRLRVSVARCRRSCPRFTQQETQLKSLRVLLLRRRRRRRRKQQRSLWMHPLTVDRLTSGQFYTIMSELKQDSCKVS
ncbi:hypothetical protein PR048_011658 [Dryococelus australis]|uniref:Uncharacterized protein n=1 Tax=Dryococelus australis TaxID=614101 RepID=A0ABQ9HM93_9NEOP|nr:hypothetical protein PR048_011658 [Dryococelus australis]